MIELTECDIARCHQIVRDHKALIRSILEQVAGITGISVARLVGPRQDRQSTQARQICYYIAVREGVTREEIGDAMGREQSTVTHGFQAECKRRGEDPKALQRIENPAKISGPGGVTSATPGPDHRQSDKETAHHG